MNYSLTELRNILLSKIEKLTQLEPYWNKCSACPNHGKCCINANISIREDEWVIIKDYISTLCAQDKLLLSENINNHIFCPFRTTEKCLIHAVRPLNCLYTPYQLAQNVKTGDIHYSVVDNNCSFTSKEIKGHPLLNSEIPFIQADSFGQPRNYLFLNNFIINYEHSDKKYFPLSELISEIEL